MKCPKCDFEQEDQKLECIRCGIIFEKYGRIQDLRQRTDTPQKKAEHRNPSHSEMIKELIFYVEPNVNPLVFGFRVLIFLILIVWSFKLIFSSIGSNYVGESIWHMINLPFHEAGHIIFRPFGRVITSLGGSLGQLIMPVVCLTVFLLATRDAFASSFALWWTGENFLDLAPYINDARSLTLPLLGGNTGQTAPYGFHDWEFILKELGLIRYDHFLAQCSHVAGSALMITSFVWGGYLLYKQYQRR